MGWSIYIPHQFVSLDYEINYEVPSILGRPILANEWALVNIEYGELKVWVDGVEVTFNAYNFLKQSRYLQVTLLIVDEVIDTIEMDFKSEQLVMVL